MKESISLRLRLDRHRSDEGLFVQNDRDDYMTLITLLYCTGCHLLIIHQPTCFYRIILDLGSPPLSYGWGVEAMSSPWKIIVGTMIAFSHSRLFFSSRWRWWFISHNCWTPRCIISLFYPKQTKYPTVISAKWGKLSGNGSLDTTMEWCYGCNVKIDDMEEINRRN